MYVFVCCLYEAVFKMINKTDQKKECCQPLMIFFRILCSLNTCFIQTGPTLTHKHGVGAGYFEVT